VRHEVLDEVVRANPQTIRLARPGGPDLPSSTNLFASRRARSLVAALWLGAGACSASEAAKGPEVAIPSSSGSTAEPVMAPERASEPEASLEPVRWEIAEPDARARARREKLPMLVYLRADWAVASAQMEREVWTDERVIRASRAFVALKIDLTRAEGDAELYAERYSAPAVPAVLVFDADGRRVGIIAGRTGAGEILEAMERATE
jgi:thiol:disulfide interchange protein